MKPLEISVSSWHYRLLREMYGHEVREDICGYTRQLIGVGLFLFIVFMFATFLLCCIGDACAWVAFMIFNQYWVTPEATAPVGLFVILLIIAVVGGHYGAQKHISIPPLAKAMWGSFHNKFCVPLEFVSAKRR